MVHTDFKKTLAERMANPTEENASNDAPVLLHDDGAPVVKVTVSGVDEVMKKTMEDAQVAMKEARRDHSKAVRATCQLATGCIQHMLEAPGSTCMTAICEKRSWT